MSRAQLIFIIDRVEKSQIAHTNAFIQAHAAPRPPPFYNTLPSPPVRERRGGGSEGRLGLNVIAEGGTGGRGGLIEGIGLCTHALFQEGGGVDRLHKTYVLSMLVCVPMLFSRKAAVSTASIRHMCLVCLCVCVARYVFLGGHFRNCVELIASVRSALSSCAMAWRVKQEQGVRRS